MKRLLIIIIHLLISPFIVQAQLLGTVSKNIKVDQFGYKCSNQKIAVISSPQVGYNTATETFAPTTTANQYVVKKVSDNSTVYTGTLSVWNSGSTDYTYATEQARFGSGDKAWWFDFSSVITAGNYYIYDIGNNVRSYSFDITDNIYNDVLKQATHSYYYQRCGVAKLAANAGAGWADPACHDLALQDLNCRAYVASGTGSSATEKDLSGGWHDAGDYNKYVNFAFRAVPDMLLAYEEELTAWADNFNIPESGNGVPDILDEVKVELDWLLKMQAATGNNSVFCMVGVRPASGASSPPSADAGQRFYGPATTSATLSAACMFALGAIQFNSIGNTAYGTILRTAADNAWTWAVANPSVTWNNNGLLSAGEQEINSTQLAERKLSAAAYLYVLTGTAAYKTYFEANYGSINNWYQWNAPNPNDGQIQDAMLYYTKAAGATASVKNNILNKFSLTKTQAYQYPKFTSSSDPYRSFMKDWFWGSNEFKSRQSNMYLSMIEYNLDAATHSGYKNCASGYMHYLHGVNPTSFSYLSNMVNYGAENSVQEFYNAWFVHGSALWDRVGTSTYGPPPGFVTCGPNPYYSANTTLLPPYNQPVSKSYKDWNTSSDVSWEVTENALYNNAPYIRMLSKFAVGGSCTTLPVEFSSITAKATLDKKVTIDWSTASEKNNDLFVIERSADGVQFEMIGTVKGVVTSSSTTIYNYMDPIPYSGISYYRVKQVDIDGLFSYSGIVEVNLDDHQSSLQKWLLYPNPAYEEIFLINNYMISNEDHYTIEIKDNLGKSLIVIVNVSLYSINISDLISGMYTVTIRTSEKINILKFTKQ